MLKRSYRNLAVLASWAGLLVVLAFSQEYLPTPLRVFPSPAQLIPGWTEASALLTSWQNVTVPAPHPGLAPTAVTDAGPSGSKEAMPVLEDSRHNLDRFYQSLQELKRGKKSHVRIMHYGDSINWADNVTFHLKESFQRDFGDGGRGLLTIIDAKESVLKGHTNLTKGGFTLHQIDEKTFLTPHDPTLGFTAKSFEPQLPGATTVQEAPGDAAPWKRVQILLRAPHDHPVRGTLTLRREESGEAQTLPFRANANACMPVESTLADSRKIALRFDYDGAAPYVDGFVAESAGGVSYSAIVRMGVHQAWANAITDEAFECGYRWFQPDLIVFQFGINESASIETRFHNYTGPKYEGQLRDFYRRLRHVLPDTPILMIGPLERVKAGPAGLTVVPAQEEVRTIQRRVASDFGVAFFDTYAYMGGPGHITTMVRKGLAFNDYMHLSRDGGDTIADGVYEHLMKGFASFSGTSEARATRAESAKKILSDDPSSAILFNSRSYAVFLFVVLLVSSLLIRWPALRTLFFIAASILFYTSWMVWPIILIVFSTGLDYFCARAIEDARKRGGRGRVFIVLSLSGNLGLLFFFKYFDFLAGLLNGLFEMTLHARPIPLLHLLLPVGISFYTFQTLSYTIDVYRGSLPAERNPLRFAFFVSFFPQLVAGPIVRASTFLPTIRHKMRHFVVTHRYFNEGLFLILTGLLKKMLADWIGVTMVDRVYASPQMFTSLENLSAVYAYGLQIYGDFSGYSDIAIGSAMILGFHLTENFRRPYQSASISEFWRRWHISLGSWLRDYLYISLGGNRTGVARNLFITMFLGGLWHGAGINFVVWGVFHGAMLIFERLTGLDRRRPASSFEHAARVVFTLHLVLLAWIPFRLGDMHTIRAVLDGIAGGNWQLQNLEMRGLMVVGLAYTWHITPIQWKEWILDHWQRTAWPLQGMAAAAITVVLFQLAMPNVQPFIYFQF